MLSIENFLIQNFDRGVSNLEELSSYTLAYYLANEEEKELILELFRKILEKIQDNNFSELERNVYSKTLFGVTENKIINNWLEVNINNLISYQNINELELFVWQFIKTRITNKSFMSFNQPQYIDEIFNNWVSNSSYSSIFSELESYNIRMGNTSQARRLTVEYIIQICEKAISFEGTLILSSIIEFLKLYEERLDISDLELSLKVFQKKMKYGLNSAMAIIIYEMGFNDRFLAIEIENLLPDTNSSYRDIKDFIKSNILVEDILNNYPSYFTKVYRAL